MLVQAGIGTVSAGASALISLQDTFEVALLEASTLTPFAPRDDHITHLRLRLK